MALICFPLLSSGHPPTQGCIAQSQTMKPYTAHPLTCTDPWPGSPALRFGLQMVFLKAVICPQRAWYCEGRSGDYLLNTQSSAARSPLMCSTQEPGPSPSPEGQECWEQSSPDPDLLLPVPKHCDQCDNNRWGGMLGDTDTQGHTEGRPR